MPSLRQVAVIIDATRVYQRKILPGIADFANDVGNWELYVEEGPQEKLPDFQTWRGDGILASLYVRHIAEALGKVRIPVVKIETTNLNSLIRGAPVFRTNNEAIGRMGAEHLLDQGFRSLAYYGFPRSGLTLFSTERAEAFRRRAEEADAACSVYTGRFLHARKWNELQSGLQAWLSDLKKPVGLMASQDAKARHVLEACRKLGLRVPEDVAVLGVDNDEILCRVTRPSLSSIEQGARRLGYEAAAMLQRFMDGEKATDGEFLIEPEGVVRRQSTDTVAVDDPDVASAVRFIRQETARGLKVADVVEHVGLSRSSLRMKFQAALQRTVDDEIRAARLNRAKELIATTDLPLKLVSLKSGFPHVQHLTNTFRTAVGITPAEYRRRAGSIPRLRPDAERTSPEYRSPD